MLSIDPPRAQSVDSTRSRTFTPSIQVHGGSEVAPSSSDSQPATNVDPLNDRTIDDILLMGCDYLEPISEKHACCKALVTLLCGQLLDYGAEAPSPEVELAFKKMARACKEQMRE